jgi:hypothetical protein
MVVAEKMMKIMNVIDKEEQSTTQSTFIYYTVFEL